MSLDKALNAHTWRSKSRDSPVELSVAFEGTGLVTLRERVLAVEVGRDPLSNGTGDEKDQ